jgi:hypothetical protein
MSLAEKAKDLWSFVEKTRNAGGAAPLDCNVMGTMDPFRQIEGQHYPYSHPGIMQHRGMLGLQDHFGTFPGAAANNAFSSMGLPSQQVASHQAAFMMGGNSPGGYGELPQPQQEVFVPVQHQSDGDEEFTLGPGRPPEKTYGELHGLFQPK